MREILWIDGVDLILTSEFVSPIKQIIGNNVRLVKTGSTVFMVNAGSEDNNSFIMYLS